MGSDPLSCKPNVADLEYVLNLVAEGKIKPVIEKEYPFAETADAMQFLAAGHASGKMGV